MKYSRRFEQGKNGRWRWFLKHNKEDKIVGQCMPHGYDSAGQAREILLDILEDYHQEQQSEKWWLSYWTSFSMLLVGMQSDFLSAG